MEPQNEFDSLGRGSLNSGTSEATFWESRTAFLLDPRPKPFVPISGLFLLLSFFLLFVPHMYFAEQDVDVAATRSPGSSEACAWSPHSLDNAAAASAHRARRQLKWGRWARQWGFAMIYNYGIVLCFQIYTLKPKILNPSPCIPLQQPMRNVRVVHDTLLLSIPTPQDTLAKWVEQMRFALAYAERKLAKKARTSSSRRMSWKPMAVLS